MKVIAVANQKGGVGKTTVTRELSACCALRGYQTLVIDSDPQANLTASWVEPDIYNITLSHVLIEPEGQAGAKLEPRDLDDAIVESPLTNLDLVPADIRLARFEMQPDYLAHRLTKQIGEHASGYAEAPSQKLPAVYAEKHRAADQLWSLTDEILDRLEMTRNKLTADAERHARARGGKPGTFDFLGFTHYCAKTKDGKRFRMKRVTARKKFRPKLATFKEWLKRNRMMPTQWIMQQVGLKLRGHYAYYGW